MKTVWLNGRKMATTKGTHDYLKRKLNLPAYYGGNLDALWDVLSTISEPLHVTLLFRDQTGKESGQLQRCPDPGFPGCRKSNSNLVFEF